MKRVRGNVSDATADGKFGFNLGVGRTMFSKGIDGEDDARNTNFQSRSLAFGGATFIPNANDQYAFQRSQFFVGQFALTQVIGSKFVFQGYY